MELYLIRHGESTNNRGDPRVPDPPLTELGEEQARRVGEWLKDENITRLYCSPMLRALRTATFISDSIDLAPHVFIGLHEMGGVFDDSADGRVFLPGMTRAEMREVNPNVVLPAAVTDDGWYSSGWETFEEEVQRSYQNGLDFIAHLKANHPGKSERVAAVSHGGSGSKFLEALFEVPDFGYTRFGQYNTAVSKIIIMDDQIRLRYLNWVEHLEAEMVT